MKLNQYGALSSTTLSLIICSLLLLCSLIFGVSAFSGKQKYKNDADQLINSAVATAKLQQQSADAKAYAVELENPLTEYVGPQAYGTINLWYPKNWSGYVNTTNSGQPVDGYFYPGVLPSVEDSSSFNFALRVQVTSTSYTDALQVYQGGQKGNQDTISTYSLPKVPSVVGVKIVGPLQSGTSGTLIILPLRAETLEIWTEGNAYLTQFNNYILPNVSFSP